MAVAAARPRVVRGETARARARRLVPGLALLGLVAASAVLRTRALDAGYWIDEGLSVGIADRSLTEIPGVLRQDGSPPLYYLLLSLWSALLGSGEAATRALSLLAALAAIPAALWAGRALLGARAGWTAAGLAAALPLLTVQAQETRMYAIVALLSILVTATFALAFIRGDRRALVAFMVTGAALAYTHNWGLYLLLGLACALPVAARARGARPVVRDAAVAGAALAVAYAPWIPTLLGQLEHTGAPWSTTPDLGGLANPLTVPLGEGVAAAIVIAVAAAGLTRVRTPAVATPAIALVVAGAAAWSLAQVEPGWADRYMAVFAGPVVLLAAAGLARAGRAGLAALAAAALLWVAEGTPETKSNVRQVTRAATALAGPGDLVVATHPEQIAVVHHYAPGQLRWATALGPVGDPRTFDWRDAPGRLRRADPRATLDRVLAEPGPRRLVLIEPLGMRPGGPEWLHLVVRRAAEWREVAGRHPRLRRVAAIPAAAKRRHGTDVRALVYELREP
jgi:mannosyltransferase